MSKQLRNMQAEQAALRERQTALQRDMESAVKEPHATILQNNKQLEEVEKLRAEAEREAADLKNELAMVDMKEKLRQEMLKETKSKMDAMKKDNETLRKEVYAAQLKAVTDQLEDIKAHQQALAQQEKDARQRENSLKDDHRLDSKTLMTQLINKLPGSAPATPAPQYPPQYPYQYPPGYGGPGYGYGYGYPPQQQFMQLQGPTQRMPQLALPPPPGMGFNDPSRTPQLQYQQSAPMTVPYQQYPQPPPDNRQQPPASPEIIFMTGPNK